MEYEALKKELAAIAEIVQQFPEHVQAQVFALLADHLRADGVPSAPSRQPQVTKKPQPAAAAEKGDDAPKAQQRQTGKRAQSKESYKIDRNLNLRGDKSIPSFRDFVNEKSPQSAKEFNAVAVYYLKKLVGLDPVTLDHAYTCYDEVKKRPPEHFKQSFIDTKNKEGWVEFDDAGNLNIPHRGVVFVEHDLPRPAAKEKRAAKE